MTNSKITAIPALMFTLLSFLTVKAWAHYEIKAGSQRFGLTSAIRLESEVPACKRLVIQNIRGSILIRPSLTEKIEISVKSSDPSPSKVFVNSQLSEVELMIKMEYPPRSRIEPKPALQRRFSAPPGSLEDSQEATGETVVYLSPRSSKKTSRSNSLRKTTADLIVSIPVELVHWLEVETYSASIQIEDVSSQDLRIDLKTFSGKITVERTSKLRDLNVETVQGPVEINGYTGHLSTKSNGAEITVQGTTSGLN